MTTPKIRAATMAILAALLVAPMPALAHSFGRLYNLPVPFWLYAWGAGAALVLSFIAAGYFISVTPAGAAAASGRDLSGAAWVARLKRWRLVPAMSGLSLFCLLLCMATGFFGNGNPYVNFNMTFFWIVFVLGFAYATALAGDLYAAINPWGVAADLIGRVFSGFTRGRFTYPQQLGYWPAIVFYMGFIWIELFAHTRPLQLAEILLAYSAINLAGVFLVGSRDWFRYCEFFAVFMRLLARMAPLDYAPRQHLRLRKPFAGLLESHAERMTLLLFVLFMLSSTAFDGLRSTTTWINFFWRDPTGLITAFAGGMPIEKFVMLRPWYLTYESLCLLLSPFLYLGLYLACIGLMKKLTRSALPLHDLALRFAYSLLPIALVYNITHYFTLILTQGVKIVSLVSDPFGYGWNLFGTAGKFGAPFLPDMGWVWHSQVGLILFGHVVSVCLAHVEALRLFPDRRQALLSQLPMLLLMVLFTVAGLWILAQPIASGM